jgi:hypothetical protein
MSPGQRRSSCAPKPKALPVSNLAAGSSPNQDICHQPTKRCLGCNAMITSHNKILHLPIAGIPSLDNDSCVK